MFKNKKIGYRIGFAFFIITLLITAVTIFGINRMEFLSNITVRMYMHPFTVSNVVLHINTNIIKIHREMKDIVLAKSDEDIIGSSTIVDNLEKSVLDDFKVITERFLGSKEMYGESLELFIAWKPIRDEVISLMRSGERDKAVGITRGKGALHVKRLEESVGHLTEFALSKAASFFNDAMSAKNHALSLMYLLIILAVVLSIVFSIFITRSIVKPIVLLRDSARKIGKGELDTKIDIMSNNEIGELASSFRDMAKNLKASQRRLIQSEKMSALGVMAAGIAHEMNNPLMGISGYVEYCRKLTPVTDERHTLLGKAENGIKQCVNIVKNLLMFARLEAEDNEGLQMVNCSDILEDTLDLLTYRIRDEQVSISKNYDNDTPKVNVIVSAIRQVFQNILSNALDSFEKSSTRNININMTKIAKYVQITITDTGSGIATENLDKIYDPFFTTKPVGKGTGLGLSITKSIIESQKGEIICESKLGEGTVFKVRLPV
ncbi:MAG: ATP-binding protein [Candidatus Anammoxibacter sp.]